MLLEVRSTGRQTVFPPSVHPTGAMITWVKSGEASPTDVDTVVRSVGRLAAATLLARSWQQRAHATKPL
jgi:hypothetical protein